MPLYSPTAFSGALPCSLKREPSVVKFDPGAFVRFEALYFPVMFGLPNITGGFTLDVISVGRFGIDNAQGAFTASDPYDILFDPGASQGEQYTRAEFSAASSNAIYSGSSSVQPSSMLLIPCIKV